MSAKRKRNQTEALDSASNGGTGAVPVKKKKGRQTNEEKTIKKETVGVEKLEYRFFLENTSPMEVIKEIFRIFYFL